ncbi:MAG: hypothetical protein HKO04_12025 [Silicimonas sp.]|nr:hypothetical protein [Silicimonas sp.]
MTGSVKLQRSTRLPRNGRLWAVSDGNSYDYLADAAPHPRSALSPLLRMLQFAPMSGFQIETWPHHLLADCRIFELVRSGTLPIPSGVR